MQCKNHNPFKNRQTFHNAPEKESVRQAITHAAAHTLSKVEGIFTFPGETEHDVLNLHKAFPTARIYGCEYLKTVAIHCHYASYGVNFSLFQGDFHKKVRSDAFQFDVPIHLAWLDYQEQTKPVLFESAHQFASLYMPEPSIISLTFIDQDDMTANVERILDVLNARAPRVLDNRVYRATKTTMQSITIYMGSA
jgi:hypothetical protein